MMEILFSGKFYFSDVGSCLEKSMGSYRNERMGTISTTAEIQPLQTAIVLSNAIVSTLTTYNLSLYMLLLILESNSLRKSSDNYTNYSS